LARQAQAVDATPPKAEIVIVGAGISGLCAALEAARSGALVTVLDMASVFGGHAVMSSGMVCMVDTPEQKANHVTDSPAIAVGDFLRFGEDANRGWAEFFARNSKREVYDWLQDIGVTSWELYPQIIPGNSVRRQHVAKGRGLGLVSPIYRECLRYPNLTFRWNTKVTALMVESGQVVGVHTVNQRNKQTEDVRATFVILATGGFESNLELVRAYWPQYFPGLAEGTRILLGSGVNALGSGLDMAGKAGADLARLDHQLFYSTGLVDPRDELGKRGLHAFNRHSIWVNVQGKRFVFDGQPDPKRQVPALLSQTSATYWAIFDATSRPNFFVSGSDWNDTNVVQREIFDNSKLAQWIKRANTIDDLAEAAGLPGAILNETIQHWNDMIDKGEDVDFHRFDDSSAERPPRINKPPFYAIQLFPLARKSLGGVVVDLSCRVLDKKGRVIPNLYAAGELTGVGGINGRAALEGTMLGPGILMGRVAAKHCTNELKRPTQPPLPEPEVARSDSRSTAPDVLVSWREVLRQVIAQPRAGYFHFEKVHAAVLARDYDCGKCHTEPSPLAITGDQIDRRGMMRACAICHGGVSER
jgi:flavocytochrome c